MMTLNDVKLSFNFNLRRPCDARNATPIYCVVRLDHRQMKLPTALKVYPHHWNDRKQECVVSADMSEAERNDNIQANRVIFALRCKIDEIISYLCSGGVVVDADFMERYIKSKLAIPKDMANKNATPPKRTITATRLLKEAFDYYYRYNGNQKESTIATQQNRLNKFFTYIEETKKGNTPRLLTQEGLNDYKEWLISKANESDETKLGARAINQFCQLIARLINDVLSVNSEYRKYNFQLVRYVNLLDTRKKDDKFKRALTRKELDTFMAYIPQNGKEQEVKDLFVLQLNTGVRKGDLVRLVNGEYATDEEEPDYVVVETEKESITAVVEREHINTFNNKYPHGLKQINVNGTAFEGVYNNGIKSIFKKCGLTQTERYKENIAGRNVETTGSLNELISNHWLRHTFITLKLREGMLPDRLCYMTGHADDRMIKEVYEHLTKTDKIKAVRKEKERLGGRMTDTTLDGEIIAEKTRENFKLRKLTSTLEQEKETKEKELDYIRDKEEMFERIRRIGSHLIREGIVSRDDADDDPISAYKLMYGNIPSVEEYRQGIPEPEEQGDEAEIDI